jgi:hypothetical protein
MAAYVRHVDAFYVKNGKPTSEPNTVRQALRVVRRFYRSLPVVKFSPKKLKRVREALIDHDITRAYKVTDPETGETRTETKVLAHGMARKFINKQFNRIQLMFAWAAEEELFPVTIHMALAKVKPLGKGRSDAREKPRVRPVPESDIEAVTVLVPATIRAMIKAQLLCVGRTSRSGFRHGRHTG